MNSARTNRRRISEARWITIAAQILVILEISELHVHVPRNLGYVYGRVTPARFPAQDAKGKAPEREERESSEREGRLMMHEVSS